MNLKKNNCQFTSLLSRNSARADIACSSKDSLIDPSCSARLHQSGEEKTKKMNQYGRNKTVRHLYYQQTGEKTVCLSGVQASAKEVIMLDNSFRR